MSYKLFNDIAFIFCFSILGEMYKGQRDIEKAYKISKIPAAPCPDPTHMVTIPYF